MVSQDNNSDAVPSEVKIFYSKWKLVGQILIGAAVTATGIITVYTDLHFYIGYAIIIAGIYRLYQYCSKLPLTLPVIVLNEKGIIASEYGYFDWNAVGRIYVVRRREWRSFSDYLVVMTNSIHEILLDDLDVSFEDLENYVERFQKRHKYGVSSK
ncbi:hypothetical protein [Flavobacterium sp. GCM10027622]|uniref:hypothetical protein n=1 Tax=unclassified Flavobacterium TaxID=196869 RepID=UPI003618E92B